MISHRIRLHKDLYPQVYDWDNLLLAYCKASKGTHRALDRAQQFARRHPFSR